MRRGTWLMAIAGVVSQTVGTTGAAEPGATMMRGGVPTRYTRPATPSTSTTPTNSARPASAPTSTKNYYEELFGDVNQLDQGAQAAAAAPTKTASAAPKAAATIPATTAATAKRPLSAPPSRKIPLDDQSKVFPASKSGVTEEDRVIHAAYDQGTQRESSFIQPVRATSEAPSTARTTVATPVASSTQTPEVVLEWSKKGDINVGQECELHLVAKNVGQGVATGVKIDATFPTSVRLTNAEPKPDVATDKLVWSFDSLAAGAEKKIVLKLIPSRRGDLGTSANVTYTTQSATVFKVEEPLLKVAIKGPKEVLLGDPASQMITISNPGTGIAHNVKLEAIMSPGLEHPRGERLMIDVGSIAPGDSQVVRLGLSASKGGVQTLQVAATSSSEASASTMEKVTIIAPSLAVAMEGPALRYVGRAATYSVKVSNDGSVSNNNVRVTYAVPEGFQFVSADRGGKYDASQRAIHWFVGRLEGSQSATLTCELTAASAGDFKHAASVMSDAGVKAEGLVETSVQGVAALSTEIVDLNDPVEVGVETAWEVRVKNNGSKAASNIAIVCELPENVEVVAAQGPTQALADNGMIVFKALPQLAAGQQALFRVKVKGVVEGTHRLRAKVTSDSLDEPVVMEEATKFYSDARKTP